MACDRFVYWKERKPTQAEVEAVLHNFLGDAALEIKWHGDRFFVLLVGTKTLAFKGLGHPHEKAFLADNAPPHHKRYIEVWLDSECLDVMTRHGDEFTNAVADGLVAAFVRFWQGQLEE